MSREARNITVFKTSCAQTFLIAGRHALRRKKRVRLLIIAFILVAVLIAGGVVAGTQILVSHGW